MYAYVLNSPASGGPGNIVRINTDDYGNNSVENVGNKPAGLFITQQGTLLFVANSGDGTVSAVPANGTMGVTTQVGMPVGVVFNVNPPSSAAMARSGISSRR